MPISRERFESADAGPWGANILFYLRTHPDKAYTSTEMLAACQPPTAVPERDRAVVLTAALTDLVTSGLIRERLLDTFTMYYIIAPRHVGPSP